MVGLGVDPATGHPLYPDEDIEVTFDVPFSNDDLEKVRNSVLVESCFGAYQGIT